MSTAIDVVAALATITAAVAAFLAIRVQNRNARVSLSIDLVRQLKRDFDSEQMRAHRRNAARWLRFSQNSDHEDVPSGFYADVLTLMAFFERMGLLVERGALDDFLAWSEFGFFVMLYGSATRGLDPDLSPDMSTGIRFYFPRMESLIKRFGEIEINEAMRRGRSYTPLDPDELRSYLEYEANLSPNTS